MTVLLLIAALAQAANASPAPVSGRVVDANTGRPIVGAIVLPFGSAMQAPDRPRALTNAGGQFAIRGLHDGSLILIATKGGYLDATFGQARPAGHGRPITYRSGDTTAEITIRMWRESVITGIVTDEAGDPVIGAHVQAYSGTRVGGRKRFAPGAVATTDDRGAYRIPHLVPGDYLVAVISKQTTIPSEVTDVFFSQTASRTARDELGREMKAIDAPVIPAGSHYAMNTGAGTLVLPPGTATPTSMSDGRLMVYPSTFFPSAPAASEATVISLAAGQERSSVDIQLSLARSARVAGFLGAPSVDMASHVAVRLSAAGDEAVTGGIDVGTTITDNTGAFAFAGVPAGDYVLSVVRGPRPTQTAPDSSPMKLQSGGTIVVPRAAPAPGTAAGPPPMLADDTLWAQMPITVGGEDLANIVVPLRRAPRMSGRIVFDGTIDPPARGELEALGITLTPADGSPPVRGLDPAVGHVADDNTFTTIGVPPGRYVVGITGPLPHGWTLKNASYEGRDISDVPVELIGDDVPGVVVTFTDRPLTVEGVVRTDGQSRSDGLVLLYPVEPETWAMIGGLRRMRDARPAEDGTFSIANVPAGEYYAVAMAEDVAEWPDERTLDALARSATRVRVFDGARTTVILQPVAIR